MDLHLRPPQCVPIADREQCQPSVKMSSKFHQRSPLLLQFGRFAQPAAYPSCTTNPMVLEKLFGIRGSHPCQKSMEFLTDFAQQPLFEHLESFQHLLY